MNLKPGKTVYGSLHEIPMEERILIMARVVCAVNKLDFVVETEEKAKQYMDKLSVAVCAMLVRDCSLTADFIGTDIKGHKFVLVHVVLEPATINPERN